MEYGSTDKRGFRWHENLLCGIAFRAARWIGFLLRLRRGGGSSLPGYVFLKLCPCGLAYWASQVERVFFITGTNGKTTTTALVAGALRESGLSVITNDKGANMPSGLATAFVDAATPSGRLPQEVFVVFEVDEGSLPLLIRDLPPDIVVLLNIFPDQLDRYGSPRELSERLRRTLVDFDRRTGKNFFVIANSDQPLAVYVAQGTRSPTYFGLAKVESFVDEGEKEPQKSSFSEFCPYCGTPLVYSVHFPEELGPHLGHYVCPACGFRRPDVEVLEGRVFPARPYTRGFYLEVSGQIFPIRLPGMYNVYSTLAAWSASLVFGVSGKAFARALNRFRLPQGRMEVFRGPRGRATLNLAKNAAGMHVTLAEFLRREGSKRFLIAINNAPADGEDVSWIADAGFSLLVRADVEAVVVTGARRDDLAQVLRQVGISEGRLFLEAEPRAAVARLLDSSSSFPGTPDGGKEFFLIANYTALPPVRVALLDLGFVSVPEIVEREDGDSAPPTDSMSDQLSSRESDQTIA